jgi:hypothetical protein
VHLIRPRCTENASLIRDLAAFGAYAFILPSPIIYPSAADCPNIAANQRATATEHQADRMQGTG